MNETIDEASKGDSAPMRMASGNSVVSLEQQVSQQLQMKITERNSEEEQSNSKENSKLLAAKVD